MTQRRMLTGDTPTGQLHLGHWVGSVRRRVELQSQAECFVLIANMHAFTTRSEKPDEIRLDTLQIVRDYLAMGSILRRRRSSCRRKFRQFLSSLICLPCCCRTTA